MSKALFAIALLCLKFSEAELVELDYINGEIEDHVGFYFRKLSHFPSKIVTIGFSVYNSLSKPSATLLFHTSEENVNVQEQCSKFPYGQFVNENMVVVLTKHTFRNQDCKEVDDMVHCSATIVIQDYQPRNYYFSLGFHCDSIGSLKGLKYNISISEQTNITKCSNMTFATPCSKYYQQFSLPNLFGTSRDSFKKYYQLQNYIYMINQILGEPCYQYVEESICYISFPKCENNQLTTLCMETCMDLANACAEKFTSLLEQVSPSEVQFQALKNKMEKVSLEDWLLARCNYLPSKDGSIPCFHKPVLCENPPEVRNAVVKNETVTENKTFEVNFEWTYSCENETEIYDGNNTVTCMYSGKWSKPPQCKSKLNFRNPLYVVVPVLVAPLLFIIVICCVFKCRTKTKNIVLFRNKTFDAFVCYCYDEIDAEFAENRLRFELEENVDSPFKLCIHRRNFQAAWDIMWNINNAIKNSNSAIIVMSQDYVNSLWCKEEFEQCYMEHMKDPAFKLFVIMMQPADSLENTSLYMDSFFDQNTYLNRNDSKFFKKISDYLAWVKEPKNERNWLCLKGKRC